MSSWFYVENDDRKGPISDDEIKQLIAIFQIGPDTLVWKDGMSDWALASARFEFPNTPPNLPPGRRGAPTGLAASAQTEADGLYAGSPSRGFGEAISVCFSKYADFSGRASRSEFWYWVLFDAIGVFASSFMDELFLGYRDPPLFYIIFTLATLLPFIAVSARRLHDTDHTGWWQLLPIVNIVLGCGEGPQTPNRFG